MSISLRCLLIEVPPILVLTDFAETKNSLKLSKMLFLEESREKRVWKVRIAAFSGFLVDSASLLASLLFRLDLVWALSRVYFFRLPDPDAFVTFFG